MNRDDGIFAVMTGFRLDRETLKEDWLSERDETVHCGELEVALGSGLVGLKWKPMKVGIA
jgi:hypothetical protein